MSKFSIRRFPPLLIGVIVTPLSAAAHHETMVAQAASESEAAEVFQGEHVLILTEGLYAQTNHHRTHFQRSPSR